MTLAQLGAAVILLLAAAWLERTRRRLNWEAKSYPTQLKALQVTRAELQAMKGKP